MLDWIQVFVGLIGAVGFLALGLGVLVIARKNKSGQASTSHDVIVTIRNLNEFCEERTQKLREEIYSKEDAKNIEKIRKKEEKAALKEEKNKKKESKISEPHVNVQAQTVSSCEDAMKKRVFVLTFDGDVQASQVHGLREAISAVTPLLRKDKDEVILCVESPGGVVHGYGLAAAQLLRLKNAAHRVVICVDKIAASGGYMMACLADEIVASPFAIVGSIGAVAGVPNVHRLIKEKNVDYFEMTAGQYKRTMSLFGEVTEEKKQKFQEQLDDVHEIFKDHVKRERPKLDLATVATGEYWYGIRALENGLVDRLGTSDEVILDAMKDADVFEVTTKEKESMRDKLASKLFANVFTKFLTKSLGEGMQGLTANPRDSGINGVGGVVSQLSNVPNSTRFSQPLPSFFHDQK